MATPLSNLLGGLAEACAGDDWSKPMTGLPWVTTLVDAPRLLALGFARGPFCAA